jgi:hypothetical protein
VCLAALLRGRAEYGTLLATWAGRRLAELWGTEVLAMSESHPSWITMIRVPDFDSSEQMSYVKGRLATDFRTNASWTQWGEHTWQRLSAQIYLDRKTIEEYGQRVLALRAEHQLLHEEALHAKVDAGAVGGTSRL